MSISVNPLVSPRIITVLAPATDITMQDLVNLVRDWEDEQVDMEYDHLIDASGKQPLGGGVLVGITVTLRNAQLAFEARPGPTFVQCNATGGNLVAFDDFGNLIPAIYTTAFTQVILTSSSSATLQEVSAIQFASFNNRVTIDIVGGSDGTAYPIGTQQSPVKNLTDAVTIAVSRGFKVLYFLTDFTFLAGTYLDGYTLLGRGLTETTFTFDAGSVFLNCGAEDATVTGVVIGVATMQNVHVVDLTGYIPIPASNPVFIKDSLLGGMFTLPALYSGTVQIINCWSDATGCIVDCNGSDAVLSVTGFEGAFTLENNTNNAVLSLDMDSGKITLDSSCTSGTYRLRGVGECDNNSTGTAVVDVSGLVTPRETQYASFEGAVHIDVINGKPGILFPAGNAANPVDNIANALTISGNLNLPVLMLHSDLTITTGTVLNNFEVRAENWPSVTVEAGVEQENTVYQKVSLYGEMGGFWNTLIDCWVYDITNLCGWMRGGSMVSVALAPYTVESSGQSFFDDINPMYPGITSTVVMNTDTSVSFTNCKDIVTIESLTTGSSVNFILSGGKLIIGASCTAGGVTATGVGLLEDNSTGTVVVNAVGLVSAELIQFASFGGRVTVDAVNGVDGTSFPAGNEANPVKTLADAQAIAASRGFKEFYFLSDFTFVTGSYVDGFRLRGKGLTQTTLTFQTGSVTPYCTIEDAKVTGDILGLISMTRSHIFSIGSTTPVPSSQSLLIQDSLISGSLALPALYSGIAQLINCWTEGTPSEVDVGGATATLIVRGFMGEVTLVNNTAGTNITVDMTSGKVILDSTCSSGTHTFRGVGLLDDHSTGTAVVDATGLVSADLIQAASFNGCVSINTSSSESGTQFPAGNAANPVNNLTSAKVIALARGLNTIRVFGNLTIGAGDNINDLIFVGSGQRTTTLTLTSGCTTDNSVFKDMTISGEQNGETSYERCEIGELSNVCCFFSECRIIGPLRLSSAASDLVVARNCYSSGDASAAPLIIDLNGSPVSVALSVFSGSLQIQNFNKNPGAGAVTVNIQSGRITIDSSCTKGSIYIRGTCEIINNAAGTVVDLAGSIETVAVDRTNKNATLIPASL